MASRKGNAIPKLTKRSTQTAKTVSVQNANRDSSSEKIKLTVYLESDLLKRLRRTEFELKSEYSDSARRFSRTAIVALALEQLLDQYEAGGGIDSDVATELADR